MIYLALMFNSFCLVALKAFQQLNVVHGRKLLIIPTSYAFACAEVLLIARVANYGHYGWTVLAVGTGAWMGAVLSVEISGRIG